MTDRDLKQTPLYDRHVAADAKMVPFAGFAMPIQYPEGIRAEHARVRSTAGLFDVSHMGEFEVRGPDALKLIQWLTVNDASRLEVGQAQYSAMCREDGGVIDDLLVYRFPDRYMLVVNGARLEADWEWVRHAAEAMDVELSDRSDEIALLALQGPEAAAVLRGLTDTDLSGIGYYRFEEGSVADTGAVISRTGYTGEDGFELYLDAAAAGHVWDALLDTGSEAGLGPAGLGARDSLRLEMGYALYGNDLDEEHTAIEAGLGWIVKPDKGDFVGREALVTQKEAGPERKLVGILLQERGFPRPGYELIADGKVVGTLTSGTVSPSLEQGIGLGYVEAAYGAKGTQLAVRIRDRDVPALVQRPPFYTEGSLRR